MGSQYRLLTLFADGGLMMYPLVLCSMISVGVMIAKFFTLRIAHKGTNRVLEDVDELVQQGDVAGAIEVCYNTPGPASAILLAGLRRIEGKKLNDGEYQTHLKRVAQTVLQDISQICLDSQQLEKDTVVRELKNRIAELENKDWA